MLGNTFFRDFDDDPFFAGQRRHMHHMEQLMRPFDVRHHSVMAPAQPQHAHGHVHRHRDVARRQQQVVPFGMFGMDFGFGDMFRNMRKMMDDMHTGFGQIQAAGPAGPTGPNGPNGPNGHGPNGPNTHMFTQSSFVSYSNNGQGGAPQVYQASSSTRQAPGGVKETRQTVRDSESGLEKMSIGHHINDRAHIVERSRNRKTGDENENQEYVNLEEEEAPTFDHEWQEKSRHMHRGLEHHHHHHRARHNPIANVRSGRQPQAALMESPHPRSHSHREQRE